MKVLMLIAAMLMLVQTVGASREIVREYYANPFEVDISSMPDFHSLPVDDPSDGIDWVKVDLPPPCVDGKGKRTFIMVSKGSSDDLLVYFEGGGACTDYITCTFGVITLHPKFWLSKIMGHFGIFDRKNPLNPFRNWTILYIPYGTGDLHIGNRVMRYHSIFGSKTVYHVGFVNAVVAIRWIAQWDFDRVVIAGSSAGGYATAMHFYTARKIFGKPIIVINDAGPGITGKTGKFTFERTAECWGWLQNAPEGMLDYIEDEPIYAIGYVFDRYGDSIYGFTEDVGDYIIGTIFLKYGDEFGHKLVSVTSELRERYPEHYYRFLMNGRMHTALELPRFYRIEVNGIKLYQWVEMLINGEGKDIIGAY